MPRRRFLQESRDEQRNEWDGHVGHGPWMDSDHHPGGSGHRRTVEISASEIEDLLSAAGLLHAGTPPGQLASEAS